ncbi:prepilin-type N-terminal cleavage/methylation domain-containing protein [Fervidobacterium changbaicum]|nr:prepilin-type N-terminal cleavage/methylation domain-containing protein [Fervidobacterium changbaicum]
MTMKRKGYTFVEVLISLVVITIFFGILTLIVDMTLRSYKVSKATLQSLYANTYVNFLFDVMEGELKWAGSGSSLLVNQRYKDDPNKKLQKPKFTLGVASSYTRPGENYKQITDHLWLYDSIDIEKTADGFRIYVTYVITYPVVLKRNNDNPPTYSPLQSGYLGPSDWAIITNALSPSSSEYRPRYAKLRYYLNGQVFNGGYVKPTDKFTLKEINLAVQSVSTDLDLLSEDKFVYPVARFKNAVFNNGYVTRSFRQVIIEYDSTEKKFTMTRFMPALDLTNNYFPITLLENVEQVEASLVYRYRNEEGGIEERRIRFDNMADWNTYKNSPAIQTIKDDIIGLELKIKWKMSWGSLVGNTGEIVKTKFIVFPQASK